MAVKVKLDTASIAKGVDIDASAVAKGVDIDAGAAAKSVDLSSVTKGGVDIDASAVSRGTGGATGNALSFLRNLPGVKQLADNFPSLRKTDVNDASAEAASVRSKPSETPVPEAKQREVVSKHVEIESPDGQAALKNADDLAAKPEVSKTLSKWGVRGGIGVMFLMLLYKKNNPVDAVGEAAEDAKKTVEGFSNFLNSIFEAFKTLLAFITQNWMVSSASSCCCLLLMLLPMMTGAARSMTPRPTRFGGAYY
jgi:hypothetical protein